MALSMALSTALSMAVSADPPAAQGWTLVSTGMSKTSIGLSAVNASTIYLAGGGGSVAQGPDVAMSNDGGKSWSEVPGFSGMLSNVVKVSPTTGMRVSAGVTLKGPVAFSAAGDDGLSALQAASTKDAFSTQNIEAAHAKIFITGEWNHNADGSVCSVPASPQCSGVFVADESDFPDAKFDHVDWAGTDEAGVDARYGAYPTPTTWYVAGGMWPSAGAAQYAANRGRASSASRPPRAERRVNLRDGPLDGYRALITKTTDGGKSWATVFNDTGFNSSFGFYFNQIACADENTCWAVAECPGTECPTYGAFMYATANGGKTWTQQAFFYEVSLLKLAVVNKAHIVAIGGDVGMSRGAIVVSSADGGATWTQGSLKGHGYGFGIDMLADGKTGYAITCSIGAMGGCGFWKYSA